MLAGLDPQAAFAVALRRGDDLRARFEARRDNAADLARLRERAGGIGDVEALLADRRTLRTVLEAFQLESEIDKRAILRRVLTEDPADPRSFANRMADPRWRELASAFAQREASALTPAQVGRLDEASVRGLALKRVAGLTAEQAGGLTARQLGWMDPAQIGALQPAAFAALSPQRVAGLTPAQLRGVTAEQLGAASLAQLAAIPPAGFAGLSPEQLRGIPAARVAALTPAQLAVSTAAQLSGLTSAQAAAVTGGQRAGLSAAQLRALDAPRAPAPEAAPAGRPPLADRVLLDRLVRDATTNRYEKAMGDATPGLREALYFRRMAAGVDSINELMADRAMVEVVRGALGLPSQFGLLGFEQQRAVLTRRVDLDQFKDPKAVERMAARYLAARGPAGGTPAAVPGLPGFVNTGAAIVPVLSLRV